MEIQHFSHEEHPLMFMEEFENEVIFVCSGCDQSIYAPAYKCSLCNFFLHKSCAELSREIQHPPVHPNHTLVLQAPSQYKICDACRRCCERCFFYHCNICDFDIDIECASNWRTNADDGHQHEFFPIFQQIQFTCELCGEDRNSVAQVCRICQVLAHTLCAQSPHSIKIISDRHMLTHIHSLGKVIKEHDPVFCNLCYKKVNLKYAAYYCQQCNFVAHLDCAVAISIRLPSDSINSSIEEEEGILFKLFKEDEETALLQHFDHEHMLIISRNKVEVHDHKLCEGCMQSIISPPFYSCDQCNYFLHSTCARLPFLMRHPTHPHTLTLSAREDCIDGLVSCNACICFSHGFTYKCYECDKYSLDIRCCSIPIKGFKHEGHQHYLFLATSSVQKCNACDSWENYGRVFVCTECNFALCFQCATLPLKTKYEYDSLPLSLTYTAANNSEECYCLICEEERNSNYWFYYCVECNFVAHPHCLVGRFPYIKYGKAFAISDHQHPLSLVRRTKVSRPCDACSETFHQSSEAFDQGMALNCTQCKSTIHCWDECLDKLIKNKITSYR